MSLSESSGWIEPPSIGQSRDRVFVLNTTTQRMIDLLLHLEEIKENGPWPASKASIDALAVVEVTEPGEECAICLEEYENQDQVREMPCKHKFHKRCVDKWLKMNGSCPICRCQMPAEAEADGRVTFVFVSSRMRSVES
ncbi:unnamed protein product [Rhodiola kirilowii]